MWLSGRRRRYGRWQDGERLLSDHPFPLPVCPRPPRRPLRNKWQTGYDIIRNENVIKIGERPLQSVLYVHLLLLFFFFCFCSCSFTSTPDSSTECVRVASARMKWMSASRQFLIVNQTISHFPATPLRVALVQCPCLLACFPRHSVVRSFVGHKLTENFSCQYMGDSQCGHF